jgi:hypothetical protein
VKSTAPSEKSQHQQMLALALPDLSVQISWKLFNFRPRRLAETLALESFRIAVPLPTLAI